MSKTGNPQTRIYWMGGSPCSGKTTTAQKLAARFGLGYYSCDDAFYRHAPAVNPETQPTFNRVLHFSCEELWMRTEEEQVADELSIYREEFPMILEDLRAFPSAGPILAEGAALLPELVAPLLESPSQGVWMVPTPAFQWEHYTQRNWAKDVVKDCSNPELAFRNWMGRDVRFASEVFRQAEARGLFVLVVDGSQPIDANISLILKHMGLDGCKV